MPQAINSAVGAATSQPDIAFMSWNRFEPDGIANRWKSRGSTRCEGHAAVNAGIKLAVGKCIKLFWIDTVRRNATTRRQPARCRPRIAIVSREKRAESVWTPHNAACVRCGGNRSTTVCAKSCRIVVSLEPVRARIKRESGTSGWRSSRGVSISNAHHKTGRELSIINAGITARKRHGVHHRRRYGQVIMAKSTDVTQRAIKMSPRWRTDQILHCGLFDACSFH